MYLFYVVGYKRGTLGKVCKRRNDNLPVSKCYNTCSCIVDRKAPCSCECTGNPHFADSCICATNVQKGKVYSVVVLRLEYIKTQKI